MGVSSLSIGSRIVLRYSQRRLVTAADSSTKVPIFHFSTQQRPILLGLVRSKVLRAFAEWTIDQFCAESVTANVRQGLATVFKATVIRETKLLTELSERCGWQGLFNCNQISELALTFQGNSIAEGDTLVLCIRLGSELLGDKYSLPEPLDPTTLLAKHEAGLFAEAKRELADLGGYREHRGAAFNNNIVPRCRKLVEAVGQRMAYEAAKARGVHGECLRLYELESIDDLSVCTENGVITRSQYIKSLVDAYGAVLPLAMKMGDGADDEAYMTAAMLSEQSWRRYVSTLQAFEHNMSSPTSRKPKL